jgi:hypothetical protein
MINFSARSIGLYSLAIGSSIAFFHAIASYGEAHIKAPLAITGRYSIADRNLPNCLQTKQLLLDLQQSGIYLNASLVANSGNNIAPNTTRPTLSGQLHDRHLNLSGPLPTTLCPQLTSVRIVGTIATNGHLQGQIWFTNDRSNVRSASDTSEFTATPQSIANETSRTSH